MNMRLIDVTIFTGPQQKLEEPTRSHRRDHLSTEHTYQPSSPMGLELKLLKRALKEPPKIASAWSPSVLALGHLRGQFLGPALQGCSVDKCARLLLLDGGRRNLGT